MTLLDARIGLIIKRERQKKRLTVSGLGNLVGISHPTLTGYETGRRRVPPHRVESLAAVLEIDPRLIDPLASQSGEAPGVQREHTPKGIAAD
ncbi:helix-turn-helix domain-containing protein [Arthrobacter sp. R-11]|uniref:helix-turn-helix domain-containing protein n=1 Tax=Arthrobacter sp. R-11 TaxID=3404053 RepID=UPI003CF61954